MLRAEIGLSVLLDTVDLSDPYLVSIGDGPVIVEGALIQSHEVRNGVLNFYPIRVGQKSSVGPYAVTQKLNQAGDRVEPFICSHNLLHLPLVITNFLFRSKLQCFPHI
ncbi:hypothetical protein U1Q18_016206 [Sarracenia purpurea var. burkii]